MDQSMHAQQEKSAYFEDFESGTNFNFTVPGLKPDEIKAFALQYDPQQFHIDEDAASKTHFGGLVASGFQTQLMCFGPFCREVLIGTHAVGAPGIDDLKWLRPWRPLEDLNVTVTLVEKRISSKRNDRGYLRFKLKADSNETTVLTMEWVVMILTRASHV
jgi:acyl dehydratase